MADTEDAYYGQPTPVLAGARIAAIVLSSISAAASLLVIVSYIRVFRRFQTHQRKILDATTAAGLDGPAGADPGERRRTLHNQAAQTFGHPHCFSCESSLATPCINNSIFFSPDVFPPRQLSATESNRPTLAAVAAAGVGATHASYRSSMPPPLSHAAPHGPSGHRSSRATSLDRYRLTSSYTQAAAAPRSGDSNSADANQSLFVPAQSPMDWSTTTSADLSARRRSVSSSAAQQQEEDASGMGLLPTRRKPSTAATTSTVQPHKQEEGGRRKRLLWDPLAYCSQLASAITAERTAGNTDTGRLSGTKQQRRLPRIPSSKIAILSGIDLLLHVLWIVNTTGAHSTSGCTATLFFYQWTQLFYMFFLASFATRWALRLRNLKTVHSRRQQQRRANMVHSGATLASSLVLSLLPAVMGTSIGHDGRINACWFARNDQTALRWAWMTLDLWVALALLLLVSVSVYVCIILSNERRNMISSIAYPPPATSQPSVTNTATPPDMQLAVYRKHDAAARFALPMLPLNMYLAQQAPKRGCMCGRRSSTNSTNSTNTGSSARYRDSLYTQYPATHPIAQAHEALHGRRPGASHSRSTSNGSSNGSIRATPCGPLSAPRSLSLGSEIHSRSNRSSRSCGCGCGCPAKHVVSPTTQNGPMHVLWSQQQQQQRKMRHHSDIYGHPKASAVAVPHRLSQPGMQGGGHLGPAERAVARDATGFAAHRHQTPPVPRLLTPTTGPCLWTAAATSSSRDAIRLPRSAGAAEHQSATRRGFYVVEIPATDQHRRRYAKHMSMPVAAAPMRPRTSQQQMPSRNSCCCGGGAQPQRPHGPANVPPTSAPSTLEKEYSCVERQIEEHKSQEHKIEASRGSGLGTYQHRARGQIQRIERRVHRLLTTGAVRVAARALVPLMTQLCMVAWSTMHSLHSTKHGEDAMYAAAIILLSMQGLLDMLLYHVFDTQADVSEVSLHSFFPAATHKDVDVALPVEEVGVRGFFANPVAASSQMLLQQHRQSAEACYGCVRLSHELQHRVHRPSHGPHHHRHYKHPVSPYAPDHHTPRYTPDQYTHRWPPIASQQHQHQQHQWQLHGRSASADSTGISRRKSGLSSDSLNMRRMADRSSNAMQSDTLNGSDCMAWSHMEALSIHDATSFSQLSSTAPPPPPPPPLQQPPLQGQHVSNYRPFSYQHMPVLSGWEEADLEDHVSEDRR